MDTFSLFTGGVNIYIIIIIVTHCKQPLLRSQGSAATLFTDIVMQSAMLLLTGH